MAVAVRTAERYTPEEYLTLEETAEYKSEYFQGMIYAMAGASLDHNRIAGGVYALCRLGLRGTGCEAFNSDTRLLVKSNGLFTYPDAMIVCGQSELYKGRNDTITNPIVIFDVLSQSTQDYDRGQKFELYRGLSSLREYVLIHQDAVHIEHHRRLDLDRWLLTDLKELDAALVLSASELTLTVRDIYERVSWLAV